MWWLSLLIVPLLNPILPTKYKVIAIKGKTITLGTLSVDEMTILEWKPLFSLKTFYFHKGEAQEIFHTHSFSAISFLLYGNYIERFWNNGYVSQAPRNRSRFIWIPKDRFHQITQSVGCRTIMLTGPWGDTYREYDPNTGEIITNTHGRKEISRVLLQ